MNPYDSYAQARTKDTIKDVLETVGKDYPISFIKQVVKQEQKKADGVDDSPPKQLLPFSSDEPPKRPSGWLTKLGGVRKNWKKRWFTIDADWIVRYYASEEDAKANKKKKGEFNGCGYRVNDEDAENLVVKLESTYSDDYTKRVYEFKCEDKKDFDKWVAAFGDVCWYSSDPMHPDPLRKAAFGDMFLKLEKTRGYYYSRFYCSGSESEMLAYHIFRRVEVDVLRDVYGKIPVSGMLYNKMKSMIQATVGKTIGASVDAAWKVMDEGVTATAPKVTEQVQQLCGPLVETVAKIKASVGATLDEKLTPITTAIVAPIKEKILPLLFTPITAFFKAMIGYFSKEQDSWFSWSDIGGSIDFSAIIDCAVSLLPIPELRNFGYVVFSACQDLYTNASKSWRLKDDKNIAVTMGKLIYDAVIKFKECITWFLSNLIMKPFIEKIGEVIDAVASPLADMIPEAVKEFLDPVDIIKGLCEAAIGNQIDVMVEEGSGSIQGDLVDAANGSGVECTVPTSAEAASVANEPTAGNTTAQAAPRERGSTVAFVPEVDSDAEEGEGDAKPETIAE